MNEAKALAQQVGDFIERLQVGSGRDEDVSVDLRWLGIARTDLQKGFMSLVRSVAQPTSFRGGRTMIVPISMAVAMAEAALREVAGPRRPSPGPESWIVLPCGRSVSDDDEEEELNEGDLSLPSRPPRVGNPVSAALLRNRVSPQRRRGKR